MKYFIGTVIIIFLILIGVVVLVSRPDKSDTDTSTSTSSSSSSSTNPNAALTDFARSGSRVIITIDGVINGADKHRAIRMTISSNLRQLEVLQGYDGKVMNSISYDNDQKAYEAFLYALANSKFITKLKNSKASDDSRGSCPTGLRYNYVLESDGEIVKNLWSTSCGTGNFGGNPSLARQLFKQQFPDYQKITGGVSLY